MFKNALTLLLIFSLALNFAFAGVWVYHKYYVQPRLLEMRPQTHEFTSRPWVEHALGLRGPQRDRVRAEYSRFQKKMREIRTRAERNHKELFDLLAAPQPDREAIQKCLQRIAADRQEMQELVVEHLLAIKGMVSTEQGNRLIETLRRRLTPHSRMPLHRPFSSRGERPARPASTSETEKGQFHPAPARAGGDFRGPQVQEE